MTIGADPDREWVERIQQGDEAAFTDLVIRYKHPILNFIYRLTGNAADAEDAAQEVFVRVFRNIESFRYRREQDRFSTWLFQIARNTAIDQLRKKKRRPEESLDQMDAATRSTTDATVQAHEIGTRIAAAVSKLPEDQRTALILSEYEGLSHAQIASIMKCSDKSVESRIYRAKQYLRKLLADLMDR